MYYYEDLQEDNNWIIELIRNFMKFEERCNFLVSLSTKQKYTNLS